MFEPEELRWGIKELFETFEASGVTGRRNQLSYHPKFSVDSLPSRRFLPLAPEVSVEDFAKEAMWCRTFFNAFWHAPPPKKRVRTVYLRAWRKKNAAQWNAYRREWRARKRAA